MSEPLFRSLDSAAIANDIRKAQHSVCYAAPGILFLSPNGIGKSVNPRLLSAPRATLLPHIGSATIATRTRMARLACQGVSDVLAGRTPPNVVLPAQQPT